MTWTENELKITCTCGKIFEKGCVTMEEKKGIEKNEETESFAFEFYSDLKRANQFKNRLIVVLLIAIFALIAALAGTNIYHIYQWSQFDTVVVDSGDGEGNANYVQGDNTGGIYNGEGGSPSETGWQEQGDTN